jgi:hypothetical protein
MLPRVMLQYLQQAHEPLERAAASHHCNSAPAKPCNARYYLLFAPAGIPIVKVEHSVVNPLLLQVLLQRQQHANEPAVNHNLRTAATCAFEPVPRCKCQA